MRLWSPAEDEIILARLRPDKELAVILGRSKPSIHGRRSTLLGVKKAWRAKNRDTVAKMRLRFRAKAPDYLRDWSERNREKLNAQASARQRANKWIRDAKGVRRREASPPIELQHGRYALWSPDEDEAVLAHTIRDRELAVRLGRSYSSIMTRRCWLKKGTR